jgi:hypothetical protein
MAEIQAMLSKKLGPLPVWGWAAGVGGLVGIVYLNKKGASAPAAGTAAGQANVPYVPSPIIVTPTSMAPGTSSVNPPAAAPAPQSPMVIVRSKATSGPFASFDASNPGVPIYVKPGTGSIGVAPFGASLPSQGAPVTGPSNGFSAEYWPVTYAGVTAYIAANDVAGSGGGMGGSGVVHRIAQSGAGRIFRFTGAHAHPQYVNASGMGGGGHGHLLAISQRTKIPIGRLMALNPGHWQPRKRRPVAVHIA